jgi:hypothetical protein
MRKLIIAVMLLGLFFGVSFADNSMQLSKTYSYTNASGIPVNIFVSTSTIVPGVARIVSITVTPTPASTFGPYAAIYDATAVTGFSTANLLGEIES